MEIGEKLKELRLKKDLTLSELASRSEVTKGFLSQLERDLTSPNVSTLENILEGLGTNLQDFFSEQPEEQIVFGKDDFFVDERDYAQVQWIVPNAQKNQMEPLLLTLHPHQKTQVVGSHGGQEFGYVLKGRIRLVCGSQSYLVKAKETFYLSRAKTHYLENCTQQEAVVLWVSNPPVF